MWYNKMFFLFSCLLLLSSCGSKIGYESFSREGVDLGYISRIAVVPFENNTTDKFAAERVRDMVITQTLAFGLFDVVDRGIFDSALREEAIDLSRGYLNNTDLKRLGQILNVDAFMLGAVNSAGYVQRGPVSYPQLSLTMRLVDVESGMILWQSSGYRGGDSYGKRLFGIAAEDEFVVALKLVRRLLGTISAGADVDLQQKNDGDVFKEEGGEEPAEDEKSDDGDEGMILEQG